jgi:hypothetical protein
MSTQPSYTDIVDALSRGSVPVRQLRGPGCVAATTAAARIVAMAFAAEGPNLLWSNPLLIDRDLVKNHPERLVGGFGGDRLWFAPEVDYHWNGAPQWDTLINYQVAPDADPGAYKFFESDGQTIGLRATGKLTNRSTGQQLGFEIQRTIRLTLPPLPTNHPSMQGVEYVGIKTSNVLKVDAAASVGRIGLWHLLQMPVGSLLVVPLKCTAPPEVRTPLPYTRPGSWVEEPDHVSWRYTGEALAKFGLSAAALTGRAAVLRELDPNRWCLIVREFPVDEQATYADHPYGVPRTDQAFQAWDGLGFGEMEYHSPMLEAQHGPTELQESDELWAFGGTAFAMATLVRQLLGIDAPDLDRI